MGDEEGERDIVNEADLSKIYHQFCYLKACRISNIHITFLSSMSGLTHLDRNPVIRPGVLDTW